MCEATGRFLREAGDSGSPEAEPGRGTSAGDDSKSVAIAVHKTVFDTGNKLQRWPPSLTFWQIMKSKVPGRGVTARNRKHRSKHKKSKWEAVVDAASLAPELLTCVRP